MGKAVWKGLQRLLEAQGWNWTIKSALHCVCTRLVLPLCQQNPKNIQTLLFLLLFHRRAFFPDTHLKYLSCFLFIFHFKESGGYYGNSYFSQLILNFHPRCWVFWQSSSSDCLAFSVSNYPTPNHFLCCLRVNNTTRRLEKMHMIKTMPWPGRNADEWGDHGISTYWLSCRGQGPFRKKMGLGRERVGII